MFIKEMMNIIKELKNRKILKDITNIDKFKSLPKGAGVYIGFDPTAASLHLGNYIQIATLLRFKKFGFTPYAIIGGATGMVGDPSGKLEERNLLDEKVLLINKKAIKKQLERFGLKVIDNYDFYKNVNVLNFLRDIGKHVNINYMTAKEVVSSRLETGISFTEFAYQLIQGNDFLELYQRHGVSIQVGGSDQWGNITTGIELIRKITGDKNNAVGITTNLLESSSGEKFGKSTGNAIWISRDKTKPYQMYQYIINISDLDIKNIFLWTTFLNIAQIEAIMIKHSKEPFKRYGQKMLAKQLITDIYSEKDYQDATMISQSLFGKGDISKLSEEQLLSLEGEIVSKISNGEDIQDLLVNSEIAKSRRSARELITNGSIEIFGNKITDENLREFPWKFKSEMMIIKKGKKEFYLIKKKSV